LVLFWADAGWTAGDPTATARAAFAKAVSALQRAVGTAWEIQAVASLPRALGGLGVGILNAADDLAGGGAAFGGARSFASLDEATRVITQERFRNLPSKLYHYTDEHSANDYELSVGKE